MTTPTENGLATIPWDAEVDWGATRPTSGIDSLRFPVVVITRPIPPAR